MAKEFFGELSETLTKTAKELSGRAEVIYERQKLRNKVSAEEKIINKALADIGKIIYKRYTSGEELDEDLKILCEQMDQHMVQVEKLKAAMADVKGCKVCPSCKETVDKSAAFCPNCGTACPTPESEAEAGDVVDAEDIVVEVVDEDTAETVAEEAEVVGGAAEE